MSNTAYKILLVEDSKDDARIFLELLSGVDDPSFEVVHADCLRQGLKSLGSAQFDVVVIDLSLPDSQGLDTVAVVVTEAAKTQTPVVALTGEERNRYGVDAVRLGAVDYLDKDQVTAVVLSRCLQYAIERQRLINALAKQRAVRSHAEDHMHLTRLSERTKTSVTAQTFGVLPLKDAAPNSFVECVKEYQTLIEATCPPSAFVRHFEANR